MPFRCKCGRTFEKPNTFSSHTSSCALFHHRRVSSTLPNTVDTSRARRLSMSPTDPPSPYTMDYPAFMPTALSIQNAFEGVRRRSLSHSASLK
ncbi:hypothetical protein BC941DRAFT_11121 [Chlamydoabsidia padenii]|nr:hypothetical protein BC941DRAFT_11121 [Chlamydoabsidia padenii]